ncbi:hypothetical protein [Segnochrobactrum spirostomi]|uniref:Uncharacterized protein n=1 Tax=Segnochrobactrum spirostomi TaxID=2608987 RepID=A0A6A7Y991_9HYPH|nr:hypothetical protein [Segnochrobactrum spirostomi]MQT14039.1 hypothetical protein [Segnochrobactrum spirostomi]
MFGLEMLDVGIGMAFLFGFLSLFATAANEFIEVIVKSRARDLRDGISGLITVSSLPTEEDVLKKFYDHPAIFPLFKGALGSGSRNLPSYIPTENFVLAALSAIGGAETVGQPAIQALRASLAKSANGSPVARLCADMIDAGVDDIHAIEKNIERLYDSTMDRVSGWYARRSRMIAAAVGLAAAIVMNVDALSVANGLLNGPALRDIVVSQAADYVKTGGSDCGGTGSVTGGQPKATMGCIRDQLEATTLPIGWNDANTPRTIQEGALRLLGWIATAIAISFGAPFWFDLLNKFVDIRSTLKPAEHTAPKLGDGGPANPGSDPAAAAPPRSPGTGPQGDAAAAAALAVRDGVFEPHAWVGDPDGPQGGLL